MAETITLTKEQFDTLLAGRGTAPEGLTAEALASAFAKANRHENPQAPMVSVYNPRGETNHPRPRLRAKTRQNGAELHEDTLMWEEIEALNALPAGEFRVTKGTGNKIAFTVRMTRGADEESVESVDIHFPCKDEHRYDHRPLMDYLFEVLEAAGKTDDLRRIKALRAELNELRNR
ncbi:MAG: hypothetical protein MUF84_12100 [Anaerolineae bacterium]|nr:hypothetical protein [Anaerolineae bacterium]